MGTCAKAVEGHRTPKTLARSPYALPLQRASVRARPRALRRDVARSHHLPRSSQNARPLCPASLKFPAAATLGRLSARDGRGPNAGAFALRLAIAKGHGPRPSRALRRDFARCRHPARAPQNERPFYEGSTALSNFPRPLRLDVSAPETGADRTRVSSASAGGVAKSSPGLSEAIPPRATLRQPSGLRFIASLSSLSFSCKIANFDINWVCL